jgi:hypothetical protein
MQRTLLPFIQVLTCTRGLPLMEQLVEELGYSDRY